MEASCLTTVWASTVSYVDSFIFLYEDNFRTSQNTLNGPPRPVMEIALLFHMQMMFVPQWKHLRAPTACYGNNFTFLYEDNVHTSQKTPTGLHGLLRG
jgi:hypothetical protein